MLSFFSLYTNEKIEAPKLKCDYLLLSHDPLEKTSQGTLIKELLSQNTSLLLAEALSHKVAFSKKEFKSVVEDEVKGVFRAGMEYGRSYDLVGSALILGINNLPKFTKSPEEFIDELLLLEDDVFEYLSKNTPRALIFTAGFLLQASKRFEIILGGGATLATSLLIADKLRETVLMRPNGKNILFVSSDALKTRTTLQSLFSNLSYEQNAMYVEYDLNELDKNLLENIETNPKDENAAVPALFYYANTNSLSNKELLDEVELSYYLL